MGTSSTSSSASSASSSSSSSVSSSSASSPASSAVAAVAAATAVTPFDHVRGALSPYYPGLRHFIGGYVSGMALVFVGHPFDSIKVRVQTEGRLGRFRGPMHCLTETLRTEGFAGLYKGVTPPLLTTGLINSALFGVQGVLTEQIRTYRRSTGDPYALAQPLNAPPTFFESAVSAIVGGVVISVFASPMELVKTRLQLLYPGRPSPYSCATSCIKYMVRTHGVLSLYAGWTTLTFCRMSNWAYFGAYGIFREVFAPLGELTSSSSSSSSSPSSSSSSSSSSSNPGRPPAIVSIMAGGCSGITYWLSCYPVDVIKSRMMAASIIPDMPRELSTVRGTARYIYRKEGWKGFFTGLAPCLLRAFPANAAAFVAFDACMEWLPAKL